MNDEPATLERPTAEEAAGWIGHKVDEIGGATVGSVEGVYVDDESGEPEWLLVRMGRFGSRSLVPAREAVGAVGRVWVPYARDAIRSAPKVDPGTTVARDRELELCAHYGIAGDAGRAG